MIKLIAAVGRNLEIGKNNELIWHLNEDMKYFKNITYNSTVVMGRKTFESIGKPLPNRKNIVVTSKNINGVETVDNPKEILSLNGDVFIIGGSSIYKYFLPYADMIFLTEIESQDINADAYFPKFNKDLYNIKLRENHSENGIHFAFTVYVRK